MRHDHLAVALTHKSLSSPGAVPGVTPDRLLSLPIAALVAGCTHPTVLITQPSVKPPHRCPHYALASTGLEAQDEAGAAPPPTQVCSERCLDSDKGHQGRPFNKPHRGKKQARQPNGAGAPQTSGPRLAPCPTRGHQQPLTWHVAADQYQP